LCSAALLPHSALLLLLLLPRFRPELMEACAAWARGQRFADVLGLAPDVFEGSLVRAVRRLEELMRQVRSGGEASGSS
jgi:ATP-dependent RNA helicase DOB1